MREGDVPNTKSQNQITKETISKYWADLKLIISVK